MRLRHGRAGRRGSGLVLAAAFLVACGPAGPEGADERVRVAVRPFLSFAPFYVAQAEGLFAAQGLAVELVDFGTAEAAAALARGDVDAVSYFLSAGVFNLIGRGAKVRIVADKGVNDPTVCSADGIVARNALLESGALAAADGLRGRRVDYHQGTVAEYLLDRALAQAGLTLADVDHHPVPQAAKLEALRSGGVDLSVFSEPLISSAEAAGVARSWRSASELAPGLQWSVLVYGESLLVRRPEVGRRFMVAYLQAVDSLRGGKTRRIVEIVAERTSLPAELLQRACWPNLRRDGLIDLDSVLEFQRWAVRRGYLERVLSPEEFWEPRFVLEAARGVVARTGS